MNLDLEKAIDQETMDFINNNRSLIDWLVVADKEIDYGHIIINYHAGRITSYDITRKIRTAAKDE